MEPREGEGFYGVNFFAFTDGRFVACILTTSSEYRLIDLSGSGDVAQQRLLFRFFGQDIILSAIAFSEDGRTAVATAQSGQVVVFDPVRREVRLDVKMPGPVLQACLTADGRGLLLANANGTLYFLRLPASGAMSPRPLDPEWVKQVRGQPPPQQVQAVLSELRQRNPWFDGPMEPGLEGDDMVSLRFVTDDVTDLTPLQALHALQRLTLRASAPGKGRLKDLAPLRGLKLQSLDLRSNIIPDLTPLKDLPLETLLIDFQGKEDRAVARAMKTLQSINGKNAVDFWKEEGEK